VKKLAFIDHSFKQQSLSSAFLVDRLKENYEVKIFWDESCDGGSRVDLQLICEGTFDILILFQQISYYTIKELNSLNCSVVLIPMYDADHSRSDLSWYRYRNFKFINFSKTIHQRLMDMGIESLYCQYFMAPPLPDTSQEKRNNSSSLKGFFWQRTADITWNEIKKLIGKAHFVKIHIHTAVDPPGYELVLPQEEDRMRYEITTSNWFESKKEYLEKINEAQIFFAPRLTEGIGMAFIEAMALGKCVVAPDNPTMNEYIIHGHNGLLYNPKNPQPLDFSNFETICSNAREYVSMGFARWQTSLKQITTFIEKPKRRKFLSLPVLRKRLKLHLELKKQQRGA